MSYHKMMSKIEAILAKRKSKASAKTPKGKGLLAPKEPMREQVRESSDKEDIAAVLADYIEEIRNMKEEILRGKK